MSSRYQSLRRDETVNLESHIQRVLVAYSEDGHARCTHGPRVRIVCMEVKDQPARSEPWRIGMRRRHESVHGRCCKMFSSMTIE